MCLLRGGLRATLCLYAKGGGLPTSSAHVWGWVARKPMARYPLGKRTKLVVRPGKQSGLTGLADGIYMV